MRRGKPTASSEHFFFPPGPTIKATPAKQNNDTRHEGGPQIEFASERIQTREKGFSFFFPLSNIWLCTERKRRVMFLFSRPFALNAMSHWGKKKETDETWSIGVFRDAMTQASTRALVVFTSLPLCECERTKQSKCLKKKRKKVSLIDMGVVSHEANEDFEEQESKRFAWLARKVSWIEL